VRRLHAGDDAEGGEARAVFGVDEDDVVKDVGEAEPAAAGRDGLEGGEGGAVSSAASRPEVSRSSS
jgi:hypothetical protein